MNGGGVDGGGVDGGGVDGGGVDGAVPSHLRELLLNWVLAPPARS